MIDPPQRYLLEQSRPEAFDEYLELKISINLFEKTNVQLTSEFTKIWIWENFRFNIVVENCISSWIDFSHNSENQRGDEFWKTGKVTSG